MVSQENPDAAVIVGKFGRLRGRDAGENQDGGKATEPG
jgi:hypothetical protein